MLPTVQFQELYLATPFNKKFPADPDAIVDAAHITHAPQFAIAVAFARATLPLEDITPTSPNLRAAPAVKDISVPLEPEEADGEAITNIEDHVAGAELLQLVPSDVIKFPLVPAVAGIVAVDQMGNAEAPPDNKN